MKELIEKYEETRDDIFEQFGISTKMDIYEISLMDGVWYVPDCESEVAFAETNDAFEIDDYFAYEIWDSTQYKCGEYTALICFDVCTGSSDRFILIFRNEDRIELED